MSNSVATVTGAWSFAGCHVARRLLADGWTVRSITNRSPGPEDDPYEGLVRRIGYTGDVDRLATELSGCRVLLSNFWIRHDKPPIGHRGPWLSHLGAVALSATTSFTLTVEERPPTPPNADAGPDVEGRRGEEGVVLDGSGTLHADGSQLLTDQWNIAGASHGELSGLSSSLGGADSAAATFTVPRRRDMTDRGALDDGNWIDFER